MTNTQNKREDWEEIWKNLKDWVGSGFRYDDPSYTAQGLATMKPIFENFIAAEKAKAYEEGIREHIFEIDKLNIAAMKNPDESTADFLREIRKVAQEDLIKSLLRDFEKSTINDSFVVQTSSLMEEYLKDKAIELGIELK